MRVVLMIYKNRFEIDLIINKMLQLQLETLQWVLYKQKKNSLESLKYILNSIIDRFEFVLKVGKEI
jgi:hypothetical protein